MRPVHPFSAFAKLGPGAGARGQFTAELAGLRLIGRSARVRVPVPAAGGLAGTEDGTLLLYEALKERPPESRGRADWRSIGQALAALHGDAQQNNFVSTAAGPVVIDAAPYYGHPEADLALVGYFQPVPDDVLAAYQEILSVDAGFAGRRELTGPASSGWPADLTRPASRGHGGRPAPGPRSHPPLTSPPYQPVQWLRHPAR